MRCFEPMKGQTEARDANIDRKGKTGLSKRAKTLPSACFRAQLHLDRFRYTQRAFSIPLFDTVTYPLYSTVT